MLIKWSEFFRLKKHLSNVDLFVLEKQAAFKKIYFILKSKITDEGLVIAVIMV